MKRAIWVVAMVLPLLLASHAYAGGVTLTLNRASLTNVVDAAGTTQYEGGTIFRGATQIGNYSAIRRITTGGTDTLAEGTLTMTLLFGAKPSENITIEGVHDFNSGTYIGAVSASSNRYAWIRGATFIGQAAVSGTLTLTWQGTFPFALP